MAEVEDNAIEIESMGNSFEIRRRETKHSSEEDTMENITETDEPQFTTALSLIPATILTEIPSSDLSEETESILDLLAKGQARLELLRRLAINQQEFLKESLETLANQQLMQRLPMICSSCHRDLGDNGSDNKPASALSMRQCPMCEVMFNRNSISEDDFESHVIGHFSFEEDPEPITTLHYISSEPENDEDDVGSEGDKSSLIID